MSDDFMPSKTDLDFWRALVKHQPETKFSANTVGMLLTERERFRSVIRELARLLERDSRSLHYHPALGCGDGHKWDECPTVTCVEERAALARAREVLGT